MVWKTLWYEKYASGVVLKIIKMERFRDLMHYCVLMHWRILLFYHDHYVWHSVAVTVATPNRCLVSTTPRVCSLDQKGVQEVYEPTGGSRLTCVGHVYEVNYTSKLPLRMTTGWKQTLIIGPIYAFVCLCIITSTGDRLLSIFKILK